MAKNTDINNKHDLAFLLFNYTDEVDGITKLQKLLFLLEEETDFNNVYSTISFDFEPYYYGPFSEDVYASVEFLVSLGAIKEVENEDVDDVRNEDDWGDHSGKCFVLTDMGREISQEISRSTDEDLEEEIERVVNEYVDMTLDELLEYVYNQYPEYAVESEIKQQVLE